MLHLTIRSTEDGYYAWHLHHGPDGAFEASGHSPLLERVLEDVALTRRALARHFAADTHPEPAGTTHDAPHPASVSQVHLPSGHALPAQQDVPAFLHAAPSPLSFYPHPSSSG